jgi:hypothetical protein
LLLGVFEIIERKLPPKEGVSCVLSRFVARLIDLQLYSLDIPDIIFGDCNNDMDTMNSLDRRGQRLLLSIAYVGFSLPRRSRGLWCEDPARQQSRHSNTLSSLSSISYPAASYTLMISTCVVNVNDLNTMSSLMIIAVEH